MRPVVDGRTVRSNWIGDRFGAYSRASVVLAVFLVPVALNRNSLDAFGIPKLAVLWTLGVIALALHVVRLAEDRRHVPWPRLAIAAAIFFCACCISAAFSIAPRVSLFGLQGRYGGVIPLFTFLVSMILLASLYWDQPEKARQIAWAISLASLLVAAYAIVQEAHLDPLPWVGQIGGTRPAFPGSTIGNSNFTGAYMGLALPIGFYLLATAAPRSRPWISLSLGLQMMGIWYTQSRGAFLAGAIGLAVFGLLVRDRLSRRFRAACAGGTVVFILVGGLTLWHPWSARPPAVVEKAKVFSTASMEGRLAYWAGALRVFKEHPVVGTGPDTFYASYPPHRRFSDDPGSDHSLTDKPHNVFLEYAADTGVLGLGAYLAVIVSVLAYGVRRCRSVTGETRLLLAAFVGMLAGYLAQAFFSIDVPELAISGWVAVGTIAALADPAFVRRRQEDAAVQTATPESSPTPRWRTVGLRAGVGLVAVALCGLGVRAMRADLNAGLGQLARASQLNPLQSAYPQREGLTALAVAKATADPEDKLRHLEFARDRFERALQIQPDLWPVMPTLAETYTVWAEAIDPLRYRDAIIWWQKVIDLDPANTTLKKAFESARVDMHDHVRELDSAAAAHPEDETAWLQAAKGHLGLDEPGPGRAAIQRVLELNPGSLEARRLLATLPP
jgi:O-antigen ligase